MFTFHPEGASMHDLVIRGGTLIDGSGAPAREADVAVDGARIVAVGAGLARGRQEIDARDRIVTPGFVDIHTHYDAQATWDPYLTPSSNHGCTTVVMGSCGVGFAPAAPDRHQWLIGLMEGVEDIPGTALVEGIRWQWESFPEYLDALERMPRVLDVGAQIGHGPLRAYVMGERGAKNAPATDEDIRRMKALVKEALLAGALGFSTSRTSLHRAIDGELVPGTTAALAELSGIAEALAETGRGVFQAALEHQDVPAELGWLRALAARSRRPVTFNLSQIEEDPGLWRRGLALLDEAAAAGEPLFAQVAGRAIGIAMSMQATAHPFVLTPAYLEVVGEPWAERRALLLEPERRRRLLEEEPLALEGPQAGLARLVTTRFDRMFLMDEGFDYEPAPSRSIAALAKARGTSPRAMALDALVDDKLLYLPLFNYADGSLELLEELHRHPRTVLGLSDAGAHCGAICDGGMPTFMLTHWARDRQRGPRLALERVIRRQTRDTAALFGLHDRGLVLPGMKADLNVIDLDRLRLEPARVVADLPAGGRRLLQGARGYLATVVSGAVVVQDDAFTGALPGRLVRGPQG
jgi:N-acyl-D-amino-acid deacylase